ncbi:hypothetical protein [Magnetospirillum moscoviense]|uniref:Uncharacterized protein n=1 Tax=Magnetospirillum moscoviense TaxID=1437059 RepID=A0A178N2A2_9PROT|nr:hypothetical protein [Magnetospirillum moscoviense]OAN66991.1 hypothetical protein A6A05_05400 [Magnetospirillum moscoviense]
MGFSTVLIISLAAGVILVVGGGLMMYMANLVRSAYEIKVQINSEVEERLSKMGEDLDKKSKWIKRDLLEDIDRVKTNLFTENSSKLNDITAPLLGRIEALEQGLKAERAEWQKAVEADRATIAALEARLRRGGGGGEAAAAVQAARDAKDAKEGEAGSPAPSAAPAPGAPPTAAKPAAPTKPQSGQKPASWLPELG